MHSALSMIGVTISFFPIEPYTTHTNHVSRPLSTYVHGNVPSISADFFLFKPADVLAHDTVLIAGKIRLLIINKSFEETLASVSFHRI
jgi:hypothetical protein